HRYAALRLAQSFPTRRSSDLAGDEVGALVYNPLPVPARRALRIPKVGLTKNLLDPSSHVVQRQDSEFSDYPDDDMMMVAVDLPPDRKSTRLNSSHVKISYAVF